MLIGLWPEDDVNHLNHLYTINLQEKKTLVVDKDQKLLTLHPLLSSMCNLEYKNPC